MTILDRYFECAEFYDIGYVMDLSISDLGLHLRQIARIGRIRRRR